MFDIVAFGYDSLFCCIAREALIDDQVLLLLVLLSELENRQWTYTSAHTYLALQ